MFRVPEDLNILILPPKYIDELKSQPQSVLSSTHAVADVLLRPSAFWCFTLMPALVFSRQIYKSGHIFVWSYPLGCFEKTSRRAFRSLGEPSSGRMLFRT